MQLTNFVSPLATVSNNMRIGGNLYLSHPFGYISHMKTLDNDEAGNNWDPMNILS